MLIKCSTDCYRIHQGPKVKVKVSPMHLNVSTFYPIHHKRGNLTISFSAFEHLEHSKVNSIHRRSPRVHPKNPDVPKLVFCYSLFSEYVPRVESPRISRFAKSRLGCVSWRAWYSHISVFRKYTYTPIYESGNALSLLCVIGQT